MVHGSFLYAMSPGGIIPVDETIPLHPGNWMAVNPAPESDVGQLAEILVVLVVTTFPLFPR
jgi:hypothetical protein